MRVPEPMLAVPVDVLPLAGVAYEGKWDGYRCLLARHPDGRVELRSRRGTALTVAFGDIAAAAERDLPDSGVLLDGELVVWHEGRLAFDRLQRRLNRTAATVAREIREAPAHFVAFDVLHLAGENLMPQPRKPQALADALVAAAETDDDGYRDDASVVVLLRRAA
ncbi:hypothetical protein QT196_38720 (plasmid) [Streptomyces sp. P9-2B-2]|uniref:ATP-dependent DNA ligase n=1 Tax=Streptomyces sp. P9-2B-2 TaxID=3057114 RepID=UPI0025B5DFCF|nr:hypothetical protein [Streptomyces sp. P9-2B-2]WJY43199.1 hypothetical protein QT196_38720 [Streptomyces sp. P9-2B-2]